MERKPLASSLCGQCRDGEQAEPSCSEHGDGFGGPTKKGVGRMECRCEGFHQDGRGIADLGGDLEKSLLGCKKEWAKPSGQIVDPENPSFRAMGGEPMVAVHALDLILPQSPMGRIDLRNHPAIGLIGGQYFVPDDLGKGKGKESSGQIRRTS